MNNGLIWTHDETYLSRNYVCFHNSIDFFGQAIFWAGFKEARTYLYMRVGWPWLCFLIFAAVGPLYSFGNSVYLAFQF